MVNLILKVKIGNPIPIGMMNILVYRNDHQTKSVDYSSMVGDVFELFIETKSHFVVFSNKDYRFTTKVSKRDCRKVDNPTIEYNWK